MSIRCDADVQAMDATRHLAGWHTPGSEPCVDVETSAAAQARPAAAQRTDPDHCLRRRHPRTRTLAPALATCRLRHSAMGYATQASVACSCLVCCASLEAVSGRLWRQAASLCAMRCAWVAALHQSHHRSEAAPPPARPLALCSVRKRTCSVPPAQRMIVKCQGQATV